MQVSISAYDNFVNSINSEQTKEQYEYCLKQFLKFCEMDLDSFLKLPQGEIPNLIVNYLLQRKLSRHYKIVIFSAIKHACEMNDVILNWKKMKKFIRTDNRDNSINGKDRGYIDKEIKDSLETVNSPFESNESVFISTDTRASQRRKRERKDHYRKGVHKYRSKRIEYEEQEDPEIQAEIDRGGTVNILNDSNI